MLDTFFKTEKITEKYQYISTRSHRIMSLRTIHYSHHHEMLESHKDTIIHFICTGYDDRPTCFLLSL